MSQLALFHVERRWQRYVLVPLNIAFILAAIGFFLRQSWWIAGVFVLLVLYIGSVGSKLRMHRGKEFSELSKGITPNLPETEQGELSEDEERSLAETMVRTNYAIVVTVVALCFAADLRWYWSLVAAVVTFVISQPIASIALAFLSRSKIDARGP